MVTPLQMAVLSNSALFNGIGGDFGHSLGLNKRPWQKKSMNKEHIGN